MESRKRPAPSRANSASHKRQRSSLDIAHQLDHQNVQDPAKNAHDWFIRNGGQLHHQVEIAQSKTSGFHVRASAKVSSPTVAVCPYKLTISYLNLDHSKDYVRHVHSDLQKCLGRVPDHVLSYLLLIEQRTLREKSFWYPYIACLPLPEDMSTPVWFTPEDMKYLDGTNLVHATSEQHRLWGDEWRDAQLALDEAGIDNFKYDIVLFKWAATIMSSRSFASMRALPEIENNPILFPIVDFCNHRADAKVSWDFVEQSAFHLNVLGEFEAGEEIYNNYDPKSNEQLLMGYGFADPTNGELDTYAVKIRIPTEIENLWGAGGFSAEYLKALEDETGYFLPRSYRRSRWAHDLNIHPCFRGIPARLIYITWLGVIHDKGLKPRAEFLPKADSRMFVAVLVRLLSGIKVLCEKVPIGSQLPPPQNSKQESAKIYRDGQARVVHSIYNELNGVLESHTIMDGELAKTPIIMTVMEAFSQLEHEHRPRFRELSRGISLFCDLDPEDFEAVGRCDCEDVMWIYTLIIFYALTFRTDHEAILTGGRIYRWVEDLLRYYPLPELGRHEDPLRVTGSAPHYIHGLVDKHGLAFRAGSMWSGHWVMEWISDNRPDDNLYDRVVVWAVNVVQNESFVLPEKGRPELERYCMYIKCADDKEDWMFEEVDAEGKSIGQELFLSMPSNIFGLQGLTGCVK
ncbi:hypothetical protein BCR34DRAFT_600206 [Clohesyomyces aquaticus]|uniref:Uncharacterized protein n=1 Tax=Clohesyomyces aquaticus TaxID=1231657 RepID=A0A1Y1ZS50_9PLEO|nr:hypothetical protein BCR34DRAFT_600206 [Clohesyomyces aquaticus]